MNEVKRKKHWKKDKVLVMEMVACIDSTEDYDSLSDKRHTKIEYSLS